MFAVYFEYDAQCLMHVAHWSSCKRQQQSNRGSALATILTKNAYVSQCYAAAVVVLTCYSSSAAMLALLPFFWEQQFTTRSSERVFEGQNTGGNAINGARFSHTAFVEQSTPIARMQSQAAAAVVVYTTNSSVFGLCVLIEEVRGGVLKWYHSSAVQTNNHPCCKREYTQWDACITIQVVPYMYMFGACS
eukprot:9369-Heterococcus_DN1.PRE.3